MTETPTGNMPEDPNKDTSARYGDFQELVEQDRMNNPDATSPLTGLSYNQEKEIEEAKAEQQAQIKAQQEKEAQERQNANPLQEIGTAIVGAGIDAVEGIGGTAEMLLTGNAFNPEFEPSWLQVDDKIEPMNKTVWGNILRTGLELGLGTWATMGVGHLSKLSKVQKFLTNPVKAGAVAVFMSETSNEATLNDSLNGVMPWLNVTTTSETSTPIEKKAKHVLEELALGGIAARVFGHRAGKAVAQGLEDGTRGTGRAVEVIQGELDVVTKQLDDLPEGVTTEKLKLMKKQSQLGQELDTALGDNPQFVAERTAAEITESQQYAHAQQMELDLETYGLGKPTPAIHPDLFDNADKGLRSVRQGNLYGHMKDMLVMASRGDMAMGRRARLVTTAAIKRMARNNTELAKQIQAFGEEVQRGLDIPAGMNVGGLQTSLTGVKQLAIARYTDIVSTFPDLAKADWEDVSKMLMEDSIQVPTIAGGVTKVPNSSNAMALEMLMYDLNAAVADKAMALHSVVNKVPMQEGLHNLLDSVEAAFKMNQAGSEFAGSLLRARRGDVLQRATTNAVTKVSKDQKLSEFMTSLRKVIQSDPEMTETFLRAFAESGGDVTTMEAMRRYASDQIFNWKSVVGVDGKRSKFVDGLFNTLYNSILSAPKTMARAASGTGLLTVLRPLQIAMGGALTADKKTMAKGLHMAFDNMYGTIGEAWTLASNTHHSLVRNQAGPYVNQLVSPAESAYWKNLGRVIEETGSSGDKMMYRLTSTLQDFNNQSWVRYPSNAMTTIDAFSKTLIGRQELKAQAFEAAWNASNGNVTKKMLREYESNIRNKVFNQLGEVIDTGAEYAGKEAALQIPLTGKLGELESLLNRTPMLRPFFMFMKTGANAISVVQKHTPLLARFNGEVNAILRSTPDNLDDVLKYGIDDAAKLANAKALVRGRIATGYMTVGAATGLYTTGRLTGNGPADRELRNAWIRSGKWRPRSIKLGDKWVNYDGLEPFASFLALIADIGDNASGLGEAATENMFRKAGYLIGMNLTNKSFLAGLQPLTDVLAFDGARSEVWLANLTNNFIPFSGMRNEIANVLNPGLRELERDFMSTIANRNPILRGTLPLQYDPLNGELIRSWDFPTRMWNSISPIQISGADNPTRRTLRESGFDLATTFNTDSFGNKLNPEQRSRMMQLMGQYDIEGQLKRLFANPQIKAEMQKYKEMRERGVPGSQLDSPDNLQIKDALFYRQIAQIFRTAKRNAESELFNEFPTLITQGEERAAKRAQQRAGLIEDVDKLMYSTRNK